jgi:hypothetical protein
LRGRPSRFGDRGGVSPASDPCRAKCFRVNAYVGDVQVSKPIVGRLHET